MNIETKEEAFALVGQRIRYLAEGVGETPMTAPDGQALIAPYRVTVEGEVTGLEQTYQISRDKEWWLYVAGYGERLPASQCELILITGCDYVYEFRCPACRAEIKANFGDLSVTAS